MFYVSCFIPPPFCILLKSDTSCQNFLFSKNQNRTTNIADCHDFCQLSHIIQNMAYHCYCYCCEWKIYYS